MFTIIDKTGIALEENMKTWMAFAMVATLSAFLLVGCGATSHTLSFEPNGGNAVVEQTVKSNEVPLLPTPVKFGHEFRGWYLGEDLIDAVPNGWKPSASVTLFAKWQPVQFTLSFETNGGNDILPALFVFGQTPLSQIPLKEGYYFDGWFTNELLSIPANIQQMAVDATLFAKWSQYFGSALYFEQPIEEVGRNHFELVVASQEDYHHNLLGFAVSNEEWTYVLSGEPEFVDGFATVWVTVSDEDSEEVGSSQVDIVVE